MKFIIDIIKKYMPKEVPKPVGRWRIENCNVQMNNKIDLSNEDHCGPCGQYGLVKRNENKKRKIDFLKQKINDSNNK